MTRQQFIAKATREAERKLGIPSGWWGTRYDVRGPRGQRVFASGVGWTLTHHGKRISRHDSREFAINKAKKL